MAYPKFLIGTEVQILTEKEIKALGNNYWANIEKQGQAGMAGGTFIVYSSCSYDWFSLKHYYSLAGHTDESRWPEFMLKKVEQLKREPNGKTEQNQTNYLGGNDQSRKEGSFKPD